MKRIVLVEDDRLMREELEEMFRTSSAARAAFDKKEKEG